VVLLVGGRVVPVVGATAATAAAATPVPVGDRAAPQERTAEASNPARAKTEAAMTSAVRCVELARRRRW
jgi:hypothetical protein